MQQREHAVHEIRKFNRFYMPQFGLLGNNYLGSKYSPTEARVLFEIYEKDGCSAAQIARAMNIDKSYLSRVIRAHEKNGYLTRVVSEKDSRSLNLHLTERGIKKTEYFIRESNRQIGETIAALSEEECERLTEALDLVTDILKKCNI